MLISLSRSKYEELKSNSHHRSKTKRKEEKKNEEK